MSENSSWTPTALEVQMALTVVLSDALPERVDACLLHGSPVRSDSLDDRLIYCAGSRRAVAIDGDTSNMLPGIVYYVLNSLTREDCESKNLAYRGYESWLEGLLRVGVERGWITTIDPSWNTAIESRNFLTMAQRRGWKKLAIASQPHHQLRCFLQIIALMPEVGYYPDVYNIIPTPGIPWDFAMVKPVPPGTEGGDVVGTLREHIEAEHARLVLYAREPGMKEDGITPEFTRHATIPEMFAYLERRGK